MNLVEAYKKRLAISESVYGKAHNGAKMSNNRKLVTAKCLNNVEKFLNEAFDNSVGTQRSDLGLWKKFEKNKKAITGVLAISILGGLALSVIDRYVFGSFIDPVLHSYDNKPTIEYILMHLLMAEYLRRF